MHIFTILAVLDVSIESFLRCKCFVAMRTLKCFFGTPRIWIVNYVLSKCSNRKLNVTSTALYYACFSFWHDVRVFGIQMVKYEIDSMELILLFQIIKIAKKRILSKKNDGKNSYNSYKRIRQLKIGSCLYFAGMK